MLKWSAIFFVIAIIAAVFGFTGIAAGAASIAKTLFFISDHHLVGIAGVGDYCF
jgi:uncharacterized membrane protein YtjA (UPF0391 family)